MQLNCLLDLLETKKYIKISSSRRGYTKDKIQIPTEIRIDAKNNLTKENFSKIKQLVKDTNEVITTVDKWDNGMMFIIKKDLEKFIEKLDSTNEEKIYLGYRHYLDKEERKWINENTHFKTNDGQTLINKKLEKLRLESENQKNKEAEKLLNALLN